MEESVVVPTTSSATSGWRARLGHGDARGMQLEEIEMMFEEVRPGCRGTLKFSELRGSLARLASEDANVERRLRAALDVVEWWEGEEGRYITIEQFLQAVRLGIPEDAAALRLRLRGRVPPRCGHPTVGRRFLIDSLRRRQAALNGFLSLPFTVTLLVLVVAITVHNLAPQSAFKVTEAVVRDLPLEDLEVGYPVTLWSWLERRAAKSQLARFNRIVGGVRVRRLEKADDPLRPRSLCVVGAGDKLLLGLGLRKVEPDLCGDASTGKGNDTHWFLWPLSAGDSHYSAALEEVRGWWTIPTLNAATITKTSNNTSLAVVPVDGPHAVEVTVLSENTRVGQFVLCRLTFRVTRSGTTTLAKSVEALRSDPGWLNDGQRTAFILFEVVFLVMCSGLAAYRLWYPLRICGRRRRVLRGLKKEISWMNAVDVVIVFVGVAAAVTLTALKRLTGGLLQLARALPPSSSNSSEMRYSSVAFDNFLVNETSMSWPNYEFRLEAATEQATLVARVAEDVRFLAVVLCACSSLRLFRIVGLFPRVASHVYVAKRATWDLLPVLFITAPVLLAFATVGHAAFGARSDHFATFGDAVHATSLLALGFVLQGRGQSSSDIDSAWVATTWAAGIFGYGEGESPVAASSELGGGPLATLWLTGLHVASAMLIFGAIFAAAWEAHAKASQVTREARAANANVAATLACGRDSTYALIWEALACRGSRLWWKSANVVEPVQAGRKEDGGPGTGARCEDTDDAVVVVGDSAVEAAAPPQYVVEARLLDLLAKKQDATRDCVDGGGIGSSAGEIEDDSAWPVTAEQLVNELSQAWPELADSPSAERRQLDAIVEEIGKHQATLAVAASAQSAFSRGRGRLLARWWGVKGDGMSDCGNYSVGVIPTDAVRVCRRADANMIEAAELGSQLADFVERREAERAKLLGTWAEATGDVGSRAVADAADGEAWRNSRGRRCMDADTTVRNSGATSDVSKAEGDSEMELLSPPPLPCAESPEPEPMIACYTDAEGAAADAAEATQKRAAGVAAAFHAYVDDGLQTLVSSQMVRHMQLEGSIDGIARCMKTLLSEVIEGDVPGGDGGDRRPVEDGDGGAEIDAHRLVLLEAKVQDLAQRLGPLLDMDKDVVAPGVFPTISKVF